MKDHCHAQVHLGVFPTLVSRTSRLAWRQLLGVPARRHGLCLHQLHSSGPWTIPQLCVRPRMLVPKLTCALWVPALSTQNLYPRGQQPGQLCVCSGWRPVESSTSSYLVTYSKVPSLLGPCLSHLRGSDDAEPYWPHCTYLLNQLQVDCRPNCERRNNQASRRENRNKSSWTWGELSVLKQNTESANHKGRD